MFDTLVVMVPARWDIIAWAWLAFTEGAMLSVPLLPALLPIALIWHPSPYAALKLLPSLERERGARNGSSFMLFFDSCTPHHARDEMPTPTIVYILRCVVRAFHPVIVISAHQWCRRVEKKLNLTAHHKKYMYVACVNSLT